MASGVKATKTIKPASRERKPDRLAAPPAKTAAQVRAPKTTRGAAAPARPPQVSKDELRAQVEKLERANATLRAKSREANRAAKASAARIAELEEEVARLERKTASQAAPAKRGPKPATAPRSRRQSRSVDPGDAVPPGVAVEEPAPVDEEAEAARENLEENLGGK
jgi:hypothetical protein